MKATLEGIIMEKITDTRGDKSKLKLRIYQPGEKSLIDITCQESTFSSAKEGGQLKLKCNVGVYNMDGNVGMYASELF